MKSLKIILGVFLATIIVAFASVGDKAPQKVKEAFAMKFPTVTKVKWEKENASEWEAEFKIGKVEYSANFLEDGTWQETEHEVDETDVPQNVLQSIKDGFPGFEIEEVEISESTKGIFYEFEIEKGESEMEVVVALSGEVIKQEVKVDKND
ncbi:MAG: hypothetical protein CMC14_09095 [Flavobacteriaceae bacterium]|nr:hypothetical protein [Flavobacteriaceae bacterium]|tara:strand:- start:192 stop:644 length:453 start_codon:yes stop_codon:yes gene_type:complete